MKKMYISPETDHEFMQGCELMHVGDGTGGVVMPPDPAPSRGETPKL